MMTRARALPPPGRTRTGLVLSWIVLAVGAIDLIAFPLLLRERAAEARVQATAPACTDGHRGCVWEAEGTIARQWCDGLDADVCFVTIDFAGGGAEIGLSQDETRRLRAGGRHPRVRVVDGSILGVDIDGRMVAPHGTPAAAVRHLRVGIVFAALFAAGGLGGVVHFRRRLRADA